MTILRQDSISGLDVGHQQSVVHDQDVRRLGPSAGLVVGARAAGALQAGVEPAILVLGRQPAPRPGLGRPGQTEVDPLAGPAFGQPDQHFGQHPHLLRGARFHPAQGTQSYRAQVVRAALEHRRPKLAAQHLLQSRDVFPYQLVLQVDGVGRDDDPPPVGGGPKERGDQVGHRLPGAGPGFHQQVPSLRQCFRHGAGHLNLLSAVLVAGLLGGQTAARLKDGGRLIRVDRCRVLRSRQRRRSAEGWGGRRARAVGPCRAVGGDREGQVESQASAPFQVSAQLDDLAQDFGWKSGGALEQADEDLLGGAGVGQAAMRLARDHAQGLGQGGQPITPGVRE